MYLGALYQEVLAADTRVRGHGSTVAGLISGLAGVSNVGSDRNWTGSHFDQANWYAYGRLAWDPDAADARGIGFDRGANGSGPTAQYAPPVAAVFADRRKVPENLLLWFHHVGWNERLSSGRTPWHELVWRYTQGVEVVSNMRRTWAALERHVDAERFAQMAAFLAIQEREAQWWRDACIAYFQSVNRLPLPRGFAAPAHPLEYYRALEFPHVPGRG